MRYGGVTDFNAEVFTEVFKYSTSELSAIISDDPIRYPKPMYNIDEKISSFICHDRDDRFSLNPLGEFVDSHKEMRVTADCPFKGPTMSSPQTVNGQDNGMVCNSWVGR